MQRLVTPSIGVFCLLPLLAAGCGDDNADDSDAAVDAVLDASGDAGQDASELSYPIGPYGTGADDTIQNVTLIGYVDDDGDALSHNDEPRLFQLAELYQVNDPDAKLIVLNSSAEWCPPCRAEAQETPEMNAEYYPMGVRFVTTIAQDNDGASADRVVAERWADTYDLPVPVLADGTFEMGKYYDIQAIPMNMFIDAKTMKILSITTGGQEIASIMDYYLGEL